MQNSKKKPTKSTAKAKMSEAQFHVLFIKAELDKLIDVYAQQRYLVEQLTKIKNLL